MVFAAVSTRLKDWTKKSLAIKEALADKPGMGKSYHQLGRVVQERGRLDEADAWYKKSLAIKEVLVDQPGMARSYHELGIVAQERNRLDDAEGWYLKSLAIKEALAHKLGVATGCHQLGMVAYLRGRLGEAEGWHKKSLAIFKEAAGDQPTMAKTLGAVWAKLKAAQGDQTAALAFAINGLRAVRGLSQQTFKRTSSTRPPLANARPSRCRRSLAQ